MFPLIVSNVPQTGRWNLNPNEASNTRGHPNRAREIPTLALTCGEGTLGIVRKCSILPIAVALTLGSSGLQMTQEEQEFASWVLVWADQESVLESHSHVMARQKLTEAPASNLGTMMRGSLGSSQSFSFQNLPGGQILGRESQIRGLMSDTTPMSN